MHVVADTSHLKQAWSCDCAHLELASLSGLFALTGDCNYAWRLWKKSAMARYFSQETGASVSTTECWLRNSCSSLSPKPRWVICAAMRAVSSLVFPRRDATYLSMFFHHAPEFKRTAIIEAELIQNNVQAATHMSCHAWSITLADGVPVVSNTNVWLFTRDDDSNSDSMVIGLGSIDSSL